MREGVGRHRGAVPEVARGDDEGLMTEGAGEEEGKGGNKAKQPWDSVGAGISDGRGAG